MSWYHALQVKANRATGSLQTLASYTFASAQDQANYRVPEDSRNLAGRKGPGRRRYQAQPRRSA